MGQRSCKRRLTARSLCTCSSPRHPDLVLGFHSAGNPQMFSHSSLKQAASRFFFFPLLCKT